jgi:hypothetical protein
VAVISGREIQQRGAGVGLIFTAVPCDTSFRLTKTAIRQSLHWLRRQHCAPHKISRFNCLASGDVGTLSLRVCFAHPSQPLSSRGEKPATNLLNSGVKFTTYVTTTAIWW